MVSSSLPSRGIAARVYRRPPVIEAICEFQFQSDKVWDWTIPGLIYSQIEKEFPEKQQEQAFELTVAPQQNQIQKVGTALTKMQFLRADRTAMVQIGPDLLSINNTARYPGWVHFARLISEQFEIYKSVASPKGFRRIGLRYINRVEFELPRVEMTEYFHYYPHLPGNIDQTHGPFTMRVIHSLSDERDVLAVTLGTIIPSSKLSFLLDLDYSLVQPAKIQLSEGLAWVENAHVRIEDMFEASITDELRKVFEVSE